MVSLILYSTILNRLNCFLMFRGNDFRKEFALLGELRSIIPVNVSVMALTATSTISTLQVVTSVLAMDDPVIIGVSPERSNITYHVKKSHYCQN